MDFRPFAEARALARIKLEPVSKFPSRTPRDLARRLADRGQRQRADRASGSGPSGGDGFVREVLTLPREEARAAARDWFERFPKAAYMSEVESWAELADGRIRFTLRRLPSAD